VDMPSCRPVSTSDLWLWATCFPKSGATFKPRTSCESSHRAERFLREFFARPLDVYSPELHSIAYHPRRRRFRFPPVPSWFELIGNHC